MRILRCDRHPDTEALFTFELEEWGVLTEAERRECLATPGTRRYERALRVDLCAICSQELRAFLGLFQEAKVE